MPEDDTGETSYGYGWVVQPGDDGRIVGHDGGNNWSLGMYARWLDDGAMVFLVSNHAHQVGEWDLGVLVADLTLGIAEHVRDRS